jgi:NAD(P)-dependent dehydrogenase (short-subunit alcohol dehydrogenase family)
MSVDLRQKSVLVTGASLGIGRAVACAFAAEGCRLALTYHEHRDEGERAAARCRELGAPEAVALPFDAADDAGIAALAEAVVARFGGLDLLVNNAGVVDWRPFAEQEPSAIDVQLAVNLAAVLKLTHALLPQLRDGVLTIGSTAALHRSRTPATYVATKWGVRGFMKALAVERPELRLLLVHPTVTATRMNDFRGMRPERVAEVVLMAARGELELPSGGEVDLRDFAEDAT